MHAHGDEHSEPIGWTLQPMPLVAIGLGGVGFALLALAARRRGQTLSALRVTSFIAGLAVVAVALMSPLDPFGEERSPAAHMVQHELLLMVAPLLLVGGLDQRTTVPLTRWVFGPAVRSRPLRLVLAVVSNPWVVTGAWCLVVLGWHVPALYDLALDNDRVHIAEHASLLTVGLLFWIVVVGRLPSVHRTTTAQRLAALGTAMGAGGGLAAVLLWAPHLLYSAYATAEPALGLSPVQDQRLAGALMMAVDMPLLLGAALFVTARWARHTLRMNVRGRDVAAPEAGAGVQTLRLREDLMPGG
jgi:cytochrome c oxidase assembly factor CtaG